MSYTVNTIAQALPASLPDLPCAFTRRFMSDALSPGEWPVSYHGTGIGSTENIAQEGYLGSKGKKFKFVVGISSTSSIEVAAKYAQQFTHNGKQYRSISMGSNVIYYSSDILLE